MTPLALLRSLSKMSSLFTRSFAAACSVAYASVYRSFSRKCFTFEMLWILKAVFPKKLQMQSFIFQIRKREALCCQKVFHK